MIKVRVVETGGVFKELELEEDATVEECLRKAGVNLQRTKEIRINTDLAEKDDIVEDGDVVNIIPNIEGGR